MAIHINGKLKNVLLSLGSVIITFIFVIVANWLVGVFFSIPDYEVDPILPAASASLWDWRRVNVVLTVAVIELKLSNLSVRTIG